MAARLKAAVIGLGRMGSTFDDEPGHFGHWGTPHSHAPSYMAVREVEFVAGADSHPQQRADFATKWSFDAAHLYEDYRVMLERERPDIVSICTTARPRAQILAGVVAADVGVKAIWCEKPLSISLAEADQMVELCRAKGIVLAVGASRNWDPTYNRIRELIDESEIGDVLQVVALANCNLSHNGSHSITLTNYLAGGRVAWVWGHMASDEQAAGDDDLPGNGYLAYHNGVHAFVRSMPTGAAVWEFDVVGTKGRLRAWHDGEGVDFEKLVDSTLDGRRREPARFLFPRPAATRTANVRTVEDLVRCIATGEEPSCSGDDARHSLEIAIALRESHRRGGTRVELPLADRSLKMNSAETLHGDEPALIRRRKQAAAR